MRIHLLIMLVVGIGGATAHAAEPPLALCNLTSYAVRAAAAVTRRGEIETRGWFDLLPGACAEALPETPRRAALYAFAESRPAYGEGRRIWGGQTDLCVAHEGAFAMEDARSCQDDTDEMRGFAPVKPRSGPGGPRTVAFTEPAEFNRPQARAAGAQRLLIELGFLEGGADGLVGGQTRDAVAAFLDVDRWSADIDEPLLRTLLEASTARAKAIGLSVCNDAGPTIWAALGETQTDDGEVLRRSRGWWRIPPGACRVVEAGPLDPAVSRHLHAETRAPEGVQILEAREDAAIFCLDVLAFDEASVDCAARGRRTAAFRRLPPPEDGEGLVIRLRDQDFQTPEAAG